MDAHHIEHWAHGGATTMETLILLCSRHHRFLHEYGYRVVMHDGAPRFLQPDGRELGITGGERRALDALRPAVN